MRPQSRRWRDGGAYRRNGGRQPHGFGRMPARRCVGAVMNGTIGARGVPRRGPFDGRAVPSDRARVRGRDRARDRHAHPSGRSPVGTRPAPATSHRSQPCVRGSLRGRAQLPSARAPLASMAIGGTLADRRRAARGTGTRPRPPAAPVPPPGPLPSLSSTPAGRYTPPFPLGPAREPPGHQGTVQATPATPATRQDRAAPRPPSPSPLPHSTARDLDPPP